MSEKDLVLKTAVRQLSWQRGSATRIDVPLRIYVDKTLNRSGFEESTDLDMIAVDLTPDGFVRISIFDCKTSPARSTERTFWLRGVSELVDAGSAWLVRQDKLTAAARQLAHRLDIGVMTSEDIETQLKIDSFVPIPQHIAYGRLFNPGDVAEQRKRLNVRDRRLEPLLTYCQYGFWAVDDPSANLSLLVSCLGAARDGLEPRNPLHAALVWDCVWLYLLSLARAVEYVRRSDTTGVESAFREYLLGGQSGIREKEKLLEAFATLTGRIDKSILPPYYSVLLELFGRFYVRPRSIIESMRYCEVLIGSLCVGKRTRLEEASGEHFDVISAKLLADAARFLVRAAGLPVAFLESMREMAVGDSASGHGVNTAQSPPGDSGEMSDDLIVKNERVEPPSKIGDE